MSHSALRPVIKLRSTAGTGYTYVTSKSRRNDPDRLVVRKYMKQGIHPDYHPVVFRDRSANFAFLTRSTASSERTTDWEDGNTYPVVDVEVSSASHPFYTGQSRVLDTAGRVEQFRRRYGSNAKGA